MGDRATVQIVYKTQFSPVAYLHWLGEDTLDVIKTAAPKMRERDLSYSAARLFGHFHNATGGDTAGLSFGVINVDSRQESDTCGDAGHYQVDLETGVVRQWSECFDKDGDVVANVEFGDF